MLETLAFLVYEGSALPFFYKALKVGDDVLKRDLGAVILFSVDAVDETIDVVRIS